MSDEQPVHTSGPQKLLRNFGKLKAEPVDDKLGRYKSNWLRHVTRMNSRRMLKIMLNSRPNGRRRLGRPLKRQLVGDETGVSRPYW